MFNCTPAGASFFGVEAIKECKEIEKVGRNKCFEQLIQSFFLEWRSSSKEKVHPCHLRISDSDELGDVIYVRVSQSYSTTPSAVLPVLGVSEIAIRQLKSWKFFQSST